MTLKAKLAQAEKVTAYWQNMDHNNEAAVKRLVKKFGLKFATLIYWSEGEDAVREAIDTHGKDGLACISGVTMEDGGTATLFYHV